MVVHLDHDHDERERATRIDDVFGGPGAVGDDLGGWGTGTGARGECGAEGCGCGEAQVSVRVCDLASVDGNYDGVVRVGMDKD